MPPSTPPSSPLPPIIPDPSDTASSECRLREAEERLKGAIQELQRRQLSRAATAAARGPHCPPCDHPDDFCVAYAIGNLCQSFLLSYGVRVGIGILLRAFKLARGHSYSSLLDLKVALFCACMGWIMYYLEHEPDTMAPFFRGILRRFLAASRISNPSPPPNRIASYAYLQAFEAMEKPNIQEKEGAAEAAFAKYNLEAISGL